MMEFAVGGLVLAAAGATGARVPLPDLSSKKQKNHWWRLGPVSPDPDPEAMPRALTHLGRRGSVTVARRGTHGEIPDLWLAVAGVRNPQVCAEEIARAAGCRLGEPGKPKLDPAWPSWYYASVWAPEDWGPDMPGHQRWRDTTAEECSRIAADINRNLDDDEWLVTTASVARPGRSIHAVSLSTSDHAAEGWHDRPPPEMSRPSPHPAIWVAAGAAACGAAPIVGYAALGSASLEAAVLGAVAALAGVVAARSAFMRSPVVRRVCVGGPVKLRKKAGGPVAAVAALLSRGDERAKAAELSVGILAGLASPGPSVAVSAPERRAPDPVTVPDGAEIGGDLSGRRCYLAGFDRRYGVTVFGDPGSGKTTFLLNVFRSDCQRVAAGDQHAVIWLETKGDGDNRAARIAAECGVEPLVVRVGDESGSRLDLIDWSNKQRSAREMTAAMVYTFGERLIGMSSQGLLNTSFLAALSAESHQMRALGFPSGVPNVPELTFWMLGGDTVGGQADRVTEVLAANPSYAAVADYENRTPPREFKQIREAPRNKLQDMIAARGLWHPTPPHALAGETRPVVRLADAIMSHRVLILDFSQIPGGSFDELLAARAASMVTYMIREEIKRCCGSWLSENRSVALFSDELADLCGDLQYSESSEVIESLASQGRSRGVQYVFATQWPNQLPRMTRDAVSAAGVRAYFRLSNAPVASAAAGSLYDAYTAEQLTALPTGQCAVSMMRDNSRQKPFTLCPDLL